MLTILLIILSELLSFLGYYLPILNSICFFAIIILTAGLSLYKFRYGLWIILTELFIGSFGYLFYFEYGGLKISIRLALWLVVMSIWLAKIVLDILKNKKLPALNLKSNYLNYFSILFIFIIWGLLNGYHNSPSNVFFDFNQWLYFLLIFPIFSVLREEKNIEIVKKIFFLAIVWLSLKTLLLAYFFSHDFGSFLPDLYRWVRNSGVGEITMVEGGFFRIFIQSQIFVLIGFFIMLFRLFKNLKEQIVNKKTIIYNLLFSALFLSTILISFSRSFWLGLAAGGVFVWLAVIFILKTNLKQFIVFNSLIFLSIVLSLAFSAGAIFFPFPDALGGFNAADLLGDRAMQISGEAGASSRWQLLSPLWQKIKQAPLAGLGFGATVTYISSDPRILASSPSGEYTTYAFEWGWLDVWLKLGFFGLLAYLALLIKIIFSALKINSEIAAALAAGLVVLIAVNIFSPYVNHPLGIGYVLLAAAMLKSPLREF